MSVAAWIAALLGGFCLATGGALHAAPNLPRDDLQGVIRSAADAQTFTFPQEGTLGLNRAVSTVRTEARKRVSGAILRQIRDAIFSDASYQGTTGLQKSCAFDPRFGFRFTSGGRETWWLVSVSCQAAILIGPNDDWRRARTLNLTPNAVRSFTQWANG